MNDTVRYIVRYVYDNPGPAGPYKGKTVVGAPMRKGDSLRAVFGAATVTSCRLDVSPLKVSYGCGQTAPFGEGEGDR